MLATTFVLMSVLLSVNAVLRTSFVKLQSSDLASVDSNTLLNIGTVGSTIECSCMCSSKSDCGGFYFNETDGSCWSANTGQMEANPVSFYKDCGTPPTIPNTQVSAGDTNAGETRSYSCSSGYGLRNVVTVDTTCQSDGTWSAPAFDCLWDCSDPPNVANATVSTGDTVEGSTRTYTCDPLYEVDGAATVTCQTGATWSSVAFTCVAVCGTDARCPSGWCYIGNSCYLVSSSTTRLGGGLTFCQNTYPSYNAHMLQLETADENVAVVTKIMQNYPPAKFCFGLYDPLQNGVWKWRTTNASSTHSNWAPGQPDGNQYYVRVEASDNYRWRDYGHSFTCQPLCEISLQ